MSKSKKGDKPESEDEETEAPKLSPWAVEIEFYTKPSFMSGVLDVKLDEQCVTITRDDGTILSFPYAGVSKVLVMHSKRKSSTE